MIASARPPTRQSEDSSADFTSLLPAIHRHIQFAFRKVPRQLRQEVIDEAVAAAFVAFHRLISQGKASRAFASPLARFSVWRVRDGRRVGSRRHRYEACCPFNARCGFPHRAPRPLLQPCAVLGRTGRSRLSMAHSRPSRLPTRFSRMAFGPVVPESAAD